MDIKSFMGTQTYEYKDGYRIRHDDDKDNIYIIQESKWYTNGWCDVLRFTKEDIKTFYDFIELIEKRGAENE